MTTSFLGPTPLSRIRDLALKSPGTVAVPFLGKGGSRLLPLKANSLLVTRIDEASVKQGLVHPGEIAKLIRRGVAVHCCSNLHAKVYVFGQRAIVGSANISKSSMALMEACVEITEPSAVRAAKAFVMSMCTDSVGEEFAKSLIPLYPEQAGRGTGTGGKTAVALHSRMWVTPLNTDRWPTAARNADLVARPIAEQAVSDRAKARLDSFYCYGVGWNKMVVGDRVVQRYASGRGFKFDPPSRVVHIAPAGRAAIFYIERPLRLRQVSSARVRTELKAHAEGFVYQSDHNRLVRSAAAVADFARMWPALARY